MNFETIIGLEIHAELNTKSKIFCNCSTKFGAKPNTNVCPICMGLPGTLPVINKEVIDLAIKAGLALNCEINKVNKMDRKNYFYPDLPKAYQISQFDLPICKNGLVEFDLNGKKIEVRINRIHMEEDAGKLVHLDTENYSLIDYNRVGVPLIEIVTEPDLRSPEEAVAFLKILRSILQYSGVSDCKMEEGSLRCDANISLREVGDNKLGTKVEIKNINSFKEVFKALQKEEKRQKELLQYGEGHKIIQETRRWDAGKGKTISMRSKEDSHDYRYFPEPDLLPVIIKQEKIEAIRNSLPEMPLAKKERYFNEYKLKEKEIDILINDKNLSAYYEKVVDEGVDSKEACNWILVDLMGLLNESSSTIDSCLISPKNFANLIKFIDKCVVSRSVGKEILSEMYLKNITPEEVIKTKGLSQINSTEELQEIVSQVLLNNPNSILDFKQGKTQVISFLIGQVMKSTKGKANPVIAKELINKKLETM